MAKPNSTPEGSAGRDTGQDGGGGKGLTIGIDAIEGIETRLIQAGAIIQLIRVGHDDGDLPDGCIGSAVWAADGLIDEAMKILDDGTGYRTRRFNHG